MSRPREEDVPTVALTVAEALVRSPSTHPPTLTVAQARRGLERPHRHLLLIVEGDRLLGTLERHDLEGDLDPDGPALACASLARRTTRGGAGLAVVRAEMAELGQRRRAVVDDDGDLVGLLCLKASGRGFCSDEGIAARRLAGDQEP